MREKAGALLALAAVVLMMVLAVACEKSQSPQMNIPQQAIALEQANVSSKPVGLLIMDSTVPQDSDPTFGKLVLYYGLSVEKLDISNTAVTAAGLHDEAGLTYRAIAINYNTLEKLGLSGGDSIQALRDATASGASLLVSGISEKPDGSDSAGLLSLTDNTVRGARALTSTQRNWKVQSSFSDATLELTGTNVSYASEPQDDFGLLVGDGAAGVVGLITSTDDSGVTYPVFARYALGKGSIFLDSDRSGNLDQSRMIDLYNSRYFGRIIPTMMFVRYAFGDMAWHSNHRFANLTLDDPALTEPWNSFSFRKVLPHLNSSNFHITISMPPVSYSEAQKDAVDLILGNPDRFSVTIHGNNHDGYEFYKYSTSADDEYPARPLPEQEANLVEALTRMEELKRATGIPYGRVMVFPYNISPLDTITLLKKYNFAATANAANVPLGEAPKTNYDSEMYPAVMDYSSFPLLTRYEADSLPYPLLFFAGKPALALAHIDAFKDKPDAFDDLAQHINNTWGKTQVEWKSLDYIVKRLYLEKANEDGSRGVMFFSNQVVVSNDSDVVRRYDLQKVEGLEVPIKKVEVDGQAVPYSVKDGLLTLSTEIQPRSTASVSITYGADSLPDLVLASNGISYDAAKGMLKVQVENHGTAAAPVPLAVYDGANSAPVAITTLPPLAPNQSATAQIDLSKLNVNGDFTVRLDPFGVVEQSSRDNSEAHLSVPSAAVTVLDDFEYNDYPGNHGWVIQKGENMGSVQVVYDAGAGSRVLELDSWSADPQDFKVNYPALGKSLGIVKNILSVKFKSTRGLWVTPAPPATPVVPPMRDFEIFVKVTGTDGNPYYLQYVSRDGSPTTYQNYLIFPLGASSKDGAWHVLQRDLNADMRGLFSKVDYFVVTGSVRLDDLTLSSQPGPTATAGPRN